MAGYIGKIAVGTAQRVHQRLELKNACYGEVNALACAKKVIRSMPILCGEVFTVDAK
jgi:3-hydroxy-3-methylglutaryl CoA synthase